MVSPLAKRFGIGILLWSLLMITTLRFSFHLLSTDTYTIPTIAIHTHVEYPQSTDINIWSIQQCWSHLFILLFVQPKLEHHFTNELPNANNLIPNCNNNTIDLLLSDTYITLQSVNSNDKFSFHELISLRRTIMILAQNTELFTSLSNNDLYSHILKLFSTMENKFITTKRFHYPIFNIHLPRSAGTTMCYQFQLSQYHQGYHAKTINTSPKRPIYVNPEEKTNCNIKDGFPFYQYLVNSHSPKTCQEQYTQSDNFTMFARESPLYNNGDNSISHPYLCNKFVYVLSVRSPIERILSWLNMDAEFYTHNELYTHAVFADDKLELKEFVPNFFGSLFDYEMNPPKQGPYYEVIQVKGRKDNTKIRVSNQWIRGYSNNALTRWIGYEFSDRDLMNNELMKGMLAHSNIINNDDIHFYNAIQLMLRIDYVLNFASYGNDDSTQNAMRFGMNNDDNFEEFIDNDQSFWIENILRNITRIQDPNNNKSIWKMFAKHMNKHFETDVFDFNHNAMEVLKPKKNEIFNYLTPNDWKTLYEQNYFDFRLYSLSKTIGQVDAKFDQMNFV